MRNFAPNLRMRKWTLARSGKGLISSIRSSQLSLCTFQSDRVSEDTKLKMPQNRLAIDHVPAHSQINIIRITIRNVNKRFNILREAKLNITLLS